MAYIGNSPGNASQRVITQKVATAGQTRFASDSGYATGYVDVIVNGLDLVAGVDFNETGDGINIDIVEPCAAGDNVKIIAWIPRGLSDGYTKPEANALLALKADLVAGKISSSQLPAYVDDVLEYANLAAFPATGSTGIIYVAQDTNNCYRWSGSAYIVLTDLSSYYTKTQSDAKYVGKDSATGAATMPVGTTAQRPASPTSGMIRYNATLGYPEWYNPAYSSWVPFYDSGPYMVQYLVIAGGGGGGQRYSGGGAGGYRSSVTGELSGGGLSAESLLTLVPGTSYAVTIGAGGVGGTPADPSLATNGNNSSFAAITSIGGGRGAINNSVQYTGETGSSGGSGGGGNGDGYGSGLVSGGAGTSGQGFAGGTGWSQSGNNSGGGGGGAGQPGGNATSGSSLVSGGDGVSSSITGAAVVRAGGGAPARQTPSTAGSPGAGGGGFAGGGNGSANTGGGGGCGRDSSAGAGGSGIVIIRYLGSQRGTGGTITSSGGYTIHTFTSSGTFIA